MSLIDDIKRDREAGTPGPWLADIEKEEVTSNDRDICLIIGKFYGHEYFPHDRIDDPNWTGLERNISDAHRIARIPDMEVALLAAEEVVKAARSKSEFSGLVPQGPIIAAINALEKALK